VLFADRTKEMVNLQHSNQKQADERLVRNIVASWPLARYSSAGSTFELGVVEVVRLLK
jgi:hypothetical protein